MSLAQSLSTIVAASSGCVSLASVSVGWLLSFDPFVEAVVMAGKLIRNAVSKSRDVDLGSK